MLENELIRDDEFLEVAMQYNPIHCGFIIGSFYPKKAYCIKTNNGHGGSMYKLCLKINQEDKKTARCQKRLKTKTTIKMTGKIIQISNTSCLDI